MTSISNLERNFELVRSLIEGGVALSSGTAWGKTSDFWKDIFGERSNFPSVQEFLAFRRSDFGYGMADERQGAVALEEEHLRRTVEIFRQSADPSRVTALDEDSLGAPYVFESFGVWRSAAFWTNAITALRVRDMVVRHGNTDKPLAVLEIGAGWGCASYLLHQLLDIDSYTIVDLPENLFLSTNYLSASLNRPLQSIAIDGPREVRIKSGSIAFGLPGCVPAIGQQYDLVINSFSLQEMDLTTVEAYFEWISKVLSPDGIFVSFNSHGKAGVRRPSDYPLGSFRVCEIGMFRNYPTGLLNTIPYELVLTRNPKRALDADLFDVLGCLMQFGLGDNLSAICDDFVKGTLRADIANALRRLKGFFSSLPSRRAQSVSMSDIPELSATVSYLQGLDAFAGGNAGAARAALRRSVNAGLLGFAKLRALSHLAIIEGAKSLPGWKEDFDALLAYPELRRMLEESDGSPFIVQFERIVSVDL